MKRIRIVLADDHEVVRKGLRALLEAVADFDVVGEASDGLQAAELTKQLQPDALVLDLMMPGLGGLDVTLQVGKHAPKTRVVILSMHATEAYLVEALRNGASAYVIKGASAENLVFAVREAVAGRRYLSPPFSNETIEAYLAKAAEATKDPYETLTPREREVFHLAAEGLSASEIAARLAISPRTAETHRANVLRKLNLRGQTEVIRFALERGIVGLER